MPPHGRAAGSSQENLAAFQRVDCRIQPACPTQRALAHVGLAPWRKAVASARLDVPHHDVKFKFTLIVQFQVVPTRAAHANRDPNPKPSEPSPTPPSQTSSREVTAAPTAHERRADGSAPPPHPCCASRDPTANAPLHGAAPPQRQFADRETHAACPYGAPRAHPKTPLPSSRGRRLRVSHRYARSMLRQIIEAYGRPPYGPR